MTTPSVTATIAFLEADDGSFLLMKRSAIVYEGGKWGLVGGAPDPALSLREGLAAKVASELHRNYAPEDFISLGYFHLAHPDLLICAHVYKLAVGERFTPFLHEGHTDFAWVTADQALERDDLMTGLYKVLKGIGAQKAGCLPQGPLGFAAYILCCADGSLYCGFTNDLEKRLAAHNSDKGGAKYTRARRPVELVYSEAFATESEARKREYAMKRLTRAQKLALIEGYSS